MHVGASAGRGSVRPILGLALLAMVLAGCASHSKNKAGGDAHGTVTRSFSAYSSDGQLSVQVHDITTGHCWTGSVAAPGPHSYRCFAGNAILDPCFAPATGRVTQVACLAAPWSQAEVLQLTAALPTLDSPGDAPRAWAFALANGTRCVASTGTVPEVHGVNLGYHCADGRDAALLPAASGTTVADYGAQTLQQVKVTTIWRG